MTCFVLCAWVCTSLCVSEGSQGLIYPSHSYVLRLLDGKLGEAKSKKDTLKARAATAKTSKQIQELVSGANTGSNAFAAFEAMEEKVSRPDGVLTSSKSTHVLTLQQPDAESSCGRCIPESQVHCQRHCKQQVYAC